jgi:hypothetical protein
MVFAILSLPFLGYYVILTLKPGRMRYPKIGWGSEAFRKLIEKWRRRRRRIAGTEVRRSQPGEEESGWRRMKAVGTIRPEHEQLHVVVLLITE